MGQKGGSTSDQVAPGFKWMRTFEMIGSGLAESFCPLKVSGENRLIRCNEVQNDLTHMP